MEKQILSVENEVELNILQAELDGFGIKYSVIFNDSTVYPMISKGLKPFALIVSDESNRKIILEIMDNIRNSYIKSNNDIPASQEYNPITVTVFKVLFGVVILFIIISQQVTLSHYRKALTVSNQSYVYEWSSDLTMVKTYSKDKKVLLKKGYDNDRNNIFEKTEIYLPDEIIIFSEDLNQNYFYEKKTVFIGVEKASEAYSTEDNGIYDKTFYYKNGSLYKTANFDLKLNDLIVW